MRLGMQTGIPKTVEGIVSRLVAEYQPEKIVLFGSHAYGRPDQDSDLDLLVIKDTPEKAGQRHSRVRQIIAPARDHMSVDVFVLTPAELDEELRRGNQFYQEAVFRGIFLHGEREDYPMVEDSSPYARDWLPVALDDLQTAELMIENEGSAYVTGMRLQQAVEKYLKAYLLFRGWRLKRTHDLEELLNDAVEHEPTLAQHNAVCAVVTKYYVDDRYPESRRSDLTLGEVESSLDKVRPLVEHIIETSSGI